jgi:nucleoside-diphosphate kinase
VFFSHQGATRPEDSLPGTIRGDLCVIVDRNICHGSDSPDAAADEIAHWFKPEEINNWRSANHPWTLGDSK